MKSLRLLAAIVLSFSIMACEAPEKNKDGNNNTAGGGGGNVQPSKPLPAVCSQDLLARLNWRGDRLAFGYTVEVGTTKDVYNDTHTINHDQDTFLFALERGSTYYIKITKYFNNSSLTQFQKISLYVPTCDKRVDWQKAHPTYAEPFNHNVTWSN
ncbi:hypothetical protein [Bdellovibrio bacteriovorus]|uniref:hypothetical protein n=1 Tax=Bdellovibrio TaxID=958 RepID=UPI0035A8367A